MLRVLTAGESHGPELVAIIEGLPAGVPVSRDAIHADLARRKLGYGRGARMKFEQDELAISGGVRHGLSLGSPIALRIGNTEWPKWVEVMSPEPVELTDMLARSRRRPDPAAARATPTSSACRSTASTRRARCSSARAPARRPPASRSARSRARSSPSSASGSSATRSSIGPVRVPEDAAAADARRRRRARRRPAALLRRRDVRAHGRRGRRRPQGRRHARRRRRGARLRPAARASARTSTGTAASTRKLAQALMGIQAIKGVEVGDGFLTTTRRGSAAHDELFATDGGITRSSDRAGGTEGGMSTGTVLRVRAGMKPIATIPHALRTDRRRHGRDRRRAPPALGCLRRSRGGRRRRGDGRAHARQRRAREVRRRLRRRDAPQPRVATSPRFPRRSARDDAQRSGPHRA